MCRKHINSVYFYKPPINSKTSYSDETMMDETKVNQCRQLSIILFSKTSLTPWISMDAKNLLRLYYPTLQF